MMAEGAPPSCFWLRSLPWADPGGREPPAGEAGPDETLTAGSREEKYSLGGRAGPGGWGGGHRRAREEGRGGFLCLGVLSDGRPEGWSVSQQAEKRLTGPEFCSAAS